MGEPAEHRPDAPALGDGTWIETKVDFYRPDTYRSGDNMVVSVGDARVSPPGSTLALMRPNSS